MQGRPRALLIVVLLVGCHAGTRPDDAFRWRPDVRPAEYFPLAAGSVWSYDVSDATGKERLLVVQRVLSRDGNRAVFSPEPDLLAYEDRGPEIVRLPSGTPVLRAPLAAGARWEIPGGTASVVAVDGEVQAATARYRACLVVEEATAERRMRTHYAPAVGPVEVEIYARGPGGAETLAHRVVLRSFGSGEAEPTPR